MRIAFAICALGVAACGEADVRPAQDPASASVTSSSTETVPLPSVAAAPDGTRSSTPTPPAVEVAPVVASSGSGKSPTAGTAFNTPTMPAGSGPLVVDNPGVYDHTKNADNTKVNDRDRHEALTPMSQGNGANEIKITATIRRGLMGDSSLSFMAKNVKIITVGSKVTLRGPVNSDQEKSAILARAKQTPGVTDVDDQLEIKN